MLRQPRTRWIYNEGRVVRTTAPILLTPSSGIYAANVTLQVFTWIKGLGASSHRIQITLGTDPTFATPSVDVAGLTGSSHTLVSPLSTGSYIWRVGAVNSTGTTIWSSTFSLLVDVPAWEYLASLSGYRVAWWAKDADALLLRATNPYVAEGRNIVLDPGFDGAGWTTSATVSITGSKAVFTAAAAADNVRVSNPSVVQGKWFKVTYDLVVTSGTARVAVSTTVGLTRSASGTYTEYVQAGSGAQVRFEAVTTFTGTVDNLTFQQVNIRASTDYPSATGRLNVVNNPDMDFDYAFSGTNWAYSSGGYVHTPGSTTNLAQAVTNTVIGKAYDYTIVISGRTAGDVTVKIGTTGTGSTHSASGSGSNITAAGTAGVYITPSTTFDGKIESITVTPHDNLLYLNGDGSTTTGFSAQNSASLSSVSGWLRVTRNGVNNPAARQSMMIAGRRYRLTGEFRSDGNALPRIAKTDANLTGLASTSTQAFDTVFIAAGGAIDLTAVTSTGTEYAEFRNLVLKEINPLDGVISGAALTGSMPDALGGYSLTFDGVNDLVAINTAELNSLITPEKFWLSSIVRMSNLAGGSQTFIRLSFVGGDDVRPRKISASSNIGVIYTGGGVTITPSLSSGGITTPLILDAAVNIADSRLSEAVQGTELFVSLTPLPVAGNLSTSTVIGSSTGAGANLMEGDIYGIALLNYTPTDPDRLKLAQLLGVSS